MKIIRTFAAAKAVAISNAKAIATDSLIILSTYK
jgi:hypothetical protein